MIDSKPGANQGPFLALFQRELLVAFCDFDAEIVEAITKVFFRPCFTLTLVKKRVSKRTR